MATTPTFPDTSPLTFKAPTLLFPPDRVRANVALKLRPWKELGPAIQDKYRVRAHWLLKNGNVHMRDAEELAEAIYTQNPSYVQIP
jgi:hypothetical protein